MLIKQNQFALDLFSINKTQHLIEDSVLYPVVAGEELKC